MATNKPIGVVNSSRETYGYRHKETLPKKMDGVEIMELAQVLPRTSMSPEQLLNRILVEGRGDAGVNEYNTHNKRAKEVFDKTTADGGSKLQSTFLAAVLDKAEVAKRTGKSFDEAWNGTGTSVYGKTGADYARRMKEMQGAATDPRNEKLLDLIKRSAEGQLTSKEKLTTRSAHEIASMAYGSTEGVGISKTSELESPFMSALNKKFVDMTGSDATANSISRGSEALLRLEAYTKQAAGVPLGHRELNTLSWDKESPEVQRVFEAMAQDVLPSLGIKQGE